MITNSLCRMGSYRATSASLVLDICIIILIIATYYLSNEQLFRGRAMAKLLWHPDIHSAYLKIAIYIRSLYMHTYHFHWNTNASANISFSVLHQWLTCLVILFCIVRLLNNMHWRIICMNAIIFMLWYNLVKLFSGWNALYQ